MARQELRHVSLGMEPAQRMGETRQLELLRTVAEPRLMLVQVVF